MDCIPNFSFVVAPKLSSTGEGYCCVISCCLQSRALEDELVKRGLSYKMIRGKAFWDRQSYCHYGLYESLF